MTIPPAFIAEVCRHLEELTSGKRSVTVRLVALEVVKGCERPVVESNAHFSHGQPVGMPRTTVYRAEEVE